MSSFRFKTDALLISITKKSFYTIHFTIIIIDLLINNEFLNLIFKDHFDGGKMHLITSLTSLSTLLNVVYQYVTGAFTVSGNKTVNA